MPTLALTARTELRTTPALVNLARLLALPSTQLHQAIQAELETNPALEEVEPDHERCGRCGGPRLDHVCLRCGGDAALGDRGEDMAAERLLMVAAPLSPADALLADLRTSLPSSEHGIARAVLGYLDEHGLLADDPRTLARLLGVEVVRVQGVLHALRQIGPPGIATRSVRECILAQIDAIAQTDTVCPHVRVIVALHLEDLGKHRYQKIAQQMRISSAEVAAAHTFIRRMLWPYPYGMADDGGRPDARFYRAPDIMFEAHDHTISVEVPAGAMVLRVSPIYEELSSRLALLDADERAHVQQHLSRTRMFLRNLRQRSHTLLRVGHALAIRQEAFLHNGVRQLVPLTRLQIAHDVRLHESTVCRAVSEKVARLPNRAVCDLVDSQSSSG